jgi:hypothetical protein
MISALAFLSPRIVNASFAYIEKNSLFGSYMDRNSIPSVDSFVLDKIKIMKKEETGEAFKCDLHVGDHLAFNEIPSVLLYTLNTQCRISGLSYRDPYELALIDTSSNEIYHFNGSLKQFNKVLKKYFTNEMTPYFAQDIIQFYLCTLAAQQDIYVLNSFSDFQAFYDRIYSDNLMRGKSDPFYDKVTKDLIIAKAKVRDLKWTLKGSSYRFEFDSINWIDLHLEHWIIEVSPMGLRIIGRTILIKELGAGILRL